MKNAKTKKLFGSSANPEKLAMTWKGIILSLLPIIIMFAQRANVDVTETQLVELVEAVSAAISSLMIVFGLLRKLYYKVKETF